MNQKKPSYFISLDLYSQNTDSKSGKGIQIISFNPVPYAVCTPITTNTIFSVQNYSTYINTINLSVM